MVYKWKSAARIKCDAQIAGEFLSNIENTVGLTPKNVVDASRPEDSPLHNEFEWDNEVAAEKYRETQAGHIIRSIVVDVEDCVSEEPVCVRAFVNVEKDDNRNYKPIQVVIKDKDYMNSLYESAMRELKAIQFKYQSVARLKHIFDEIDKENFNGI